MQHSVMARPAFKRWWTRVIPSAMERSTYVLASSLVLILLFWLWQPLPSVVWHVTHQWGAGPLWLVFAVGWRIVVVSTFLIDHFDLFGLRQVVLNFTGARVSETPSGIFAQPAWIDAEADPPRHARLG